MNYTKIVNNAKNPVVIMVVILVIMLFLGTTMVLLNKEEKDNTNILNPPVKEEKNDYIAQSNNKEIPIYSDEVTKAMENFYKYYFDNETLYTNSSFNINNISTKEKVGTALKLINSSNIHFCHNDEEDEFDGILVENFNNALNSFNIEGNLAIDDIKALEKDYYSSKIVVNKITIEPTVDDTIKLYGPCETGFAPADYIAKKIIKAEKDGDLLYVYEKQAFAEYGENATSDAYTVNFYKDYAKTELLNTINTSITNPIDDDMNRYNTYKYTFKLYNDNYFLENFALVES